MEYVFTALIPVIAVVTVIILSKRIASHTFRCKHCSKDFNVRWSKIIVTTHNGDEYKLLCPFCKTKDWCVEQPQNN